MSPADELGALEERILNRYHQVVKEANEEIYAECLKILGRVFPTKEAMTVAINSILSTTEYKYKARGIQFAPSGKEAMVMYVVGRRQRIVWEPPQWEIVGNPGVDINAIQNKLPVQDS